LFVSKPFFPREQVSLSSALQKPHARVHFINSFDAGWQRNISSPRRSKDTKMFSCAMHIHKTAHSAQAVNLQFRCRNLLRRRRCKDARREIERQPKAGVYVCVLYWVQAESGACK
jgi:hypothetical protein